MLSSYLNQGGLEAERARIPAFIRNWIMQRQRVNRDRQQTPSNIYIVDFCNTPTVMFSPLLQIEPIPAPAIHHPLIAMVTTIAMVASPVEWSVIMDFWCTLTLWCPINEWICLTNLLFSNFRSWCAASQISSDSEKVLVGMELSFFFRFQVLLH